jgi:succinate-acetate transporter protein
MYRSRNVAHLAGATGLPVLLAGWGLVTLLVGGEVTASTWALALGLALPLSVFLLLVVRDRPLLGLETAYAAGFVGGVLVTTAGYLGLAVVAGDALRALARVGALELVVVAAVFGAGGGLLAFVDVKYVDRPRSAVFLEAEYLDDPNEEP